MLLLAMTMGFSSLKACHEGDFGALNKGHYKWGKNVGIFEYKESITVLTSTSTSCDLYTAYLEDQYQIIQEPVSYTHLRAHETPEHRVFRLLV